MQKGYVLNKTYIGRHGMKYGIYTIKDEKEIPSALLEDERTLYIKLNGKDIKDYYVDFMDIMQNAFNFHTKDCINNPMAYRDWMRGYDWGIWIHPEDENDWTMYKNVILVFEYWNEVGNGWFSSGEKVREMILRDFIEREIEDMENADGILDTLAYALGKDETDLQLFNIYLVG